MYRDAQHLITFLLSPLHFRFCKISCIANLSSFALVICIYSTLGLIHALDSRIPCIIRLNFLVIFSSSSSFSSFIFASKASTTHTFICFKSSIFIVAVWVSFWFLISLTCKVFEFKFARMASTLISGYLCAYFERVTVLNILECTIMHFLQNQCTHLCTPSRPFINLKISSVIFLHSMGASSNIHHIEGPCHPRLQSCHRLHNFRLLEKQFTSFMTVTF